MDFCGKNDDSSLYIDVIDGEINDKKWGKDNRCTPDKGNDEWMDE